MTVKKIYLYTVQMYAAATVTLCWGLVCIHGINCKQVTGHLSKGSSHLPLLVSGTSPLEKNESNNPEAEATVLVPSRNLHLLKASSFYKTRSLTNFEFLKLKGCMFVM